MSQKAEIKEEITKAHALIATARKMSAKGFFVNIISLKNIVYNIYSIMDRSELEEYQNLKPIMENLVKEMEYFADNFDGTSTEKRDLYDYNFIS